MRLLGRDLQRFAVIGFCFLVGGGIGAGGFFLWAVNAAGSGRPYLRAEREWVENMARDELDAHMKTAFLIGGAVAAVSTLALLVKKDMGLTGMED